MAPILFVAVLLAGSAAPAEPPRPLVEGLKNPTSVAVGQGGKVHVAVGGESGKERDGAVVRIDEDKAVPFAVGIDDPKGMAAYQQWLFVAGGKRVWRIDKEGMADSFAAPNAFPDGAASPHRRGGRPGERNALRQRRRRRRRKGRRRLSNNSPGTGEHPARREGPARAAPADGPGDGRRLHLLLADAGSGTLYRVKLADGSAEKVADGLGAVAGLGWDHHGRLFISDGEGGQLFVIPRPGDKPVAAATGCSTPATSAWTPPASASWCPTSRRGR